jgi:hypothetical protein
LFLTLGNFDGGNSGILGDLAMSSLRIVGYTSAMRGPMPSIFQRMEIESGDELYDKVVEYYFIQPRGRVVAVADCTIHDHNERPHARHVQKIARKLHKFGVSGMGAGSWGFMLLNMFEQR